ncbi:MlaD family protein [Conexibacter sp. DBS9H8]|uniref:MlaD family protein n=1 Tax=Conexibacter sp. DBS9H8 TaxID=2937801 RepID=UPI00200DC05C|nr:MlaD family protein [Conexibacter sp. DBS9H8]
MPERPFRLRRILRAARPSGRRPPRSRRRAAAGALLLLGVVVYLVFGGGLPWAGSPFQLRAVFTANTGLQIGSPVRVAGVDVGEVTAVAPIRGSTNAGLVTMSLTPAALPLHAGATATIQSRTFLEGNFAVALTQGSPSAPTLRSGATLPAADTAGPVQLDRVLSSLTTPVRASLDRLLSGLAGALADGGAGAINRSLGETTAALRAGAIVNEALLGGRPHDLSGAVGGLAASFGALAHHARALTGLVTGFAATMATLAGAQQALGATVARLPGTLDAADTASARLEVTLPRLGRFGVNLLPALHRLPTTITTTLPWLDALSTLTDGAHLGGLLIPLDPAVTAAAQTARAATPLLRQLAALARCVSHDLVPTGNETIRDPGAAPSGVPVYDELFQSAVGFASSAQNFDGNGRYLRSLIGGGSIPVHTRSLPVNGPLFGNAVLNPLGSRPLLPATAPTVTTTTPCGNVSPPDLNAVSTGGTP